jgi:hypothetical protein
VGLLHLLPIKFGNHLYRIPYVYSRLYELRPVRTYRLRLNAIIQPWQWNHVRNHLCRLRKSGLVTFVTDKRFTVGVIARFFVIHTAFPEHLKYRNTMQGTGGTADNIFGYAVLLDVKFWLRRKAGCGKHHLPASFIQRNVKRYQGMWTPAIRLWISSRNFSTIGS